MVLNKIIIPLKFCNFLFWVLIIVSLYNKQAYAVEYAPCQPNSSHCTLVDDLIGSHYDCACDVFCDPGEKCEKRMGIGASGYWCRESSLCVDPNPAYTDCTYGEIETCGNSILNSSCADNERCLSPANTGPGGSSRPQCVPDTSCVNDPGVCANLPGGRCILATSCTANNPQQLDCLNGTVCCTSNENDCNSMGGICDTSCGGTGVIPTGICGPGSLGQLCCRQEPAKACEVSVAAGGLGGECVTAGACGSAPLTPASGCLFTEECCPTSSTQTCEDAGGVVVRHAGCDTPIEGVVTPIGALCCNPTTLPKCNEIPGGGFCTFLHCDVTPVASSDCAAPNICCPNTQRFCEVGNAGGQPSFGGVCNGTPCTTVTQARECSVCCLNSDAIPPPDGNDDDPRGPTYTSEYTGPKITVNQLIGLIYDIMLPISIGVGLLFIIKAGYVLKTSEGNPTKKQQGIDDLTGAVVGTLFVGLSLVILRVIINSILGGNI